MVDIINPKVNVIDYGPNITLPDETIITPDEIIYGAAGITYRDTGALQQLMDLKSGKVKLDEEKYRGLSVQQVIKKSLISSASSGHASMSTTPGFWMYLEGNCSKMVDSIFTGARFSSSLMPSGRRIPVTKEQIVIPQSIVNTRFEKDYMRISKANIELYEQLQLKKVPKEEAAKIVQYGHRGGGFAFMPLETLISVARNIKEDGSLVPREARKIVSQLEDFIYSHGMGITYEARTNAPRTGCPNPNIFHKRKNLAQELIEQNYEGVLENPVLISVTDIDTMLGERNIKIADYLTKREKLFSTQEGVEANWKNMLRELELIVEDYNDSISVKTISSSPWRVWGEVKRHRTLGQTTESVYNAINRAINVVNNTSAVFGNSIRFNEVVSIPPQIEENKELLTSWINAFSNSVKTYERMIGEGVKESDAIMIIPRGLKLGIAKTYDFYNLTAGYMSLRLCNTAEPEMRRTTEQEKELIINSNKISSEIKQLISPKCNYVGFCPDRYCGKVNLVSPFYTKEIHSEMKKFREEFVALEIDNFHPED